MNGKVQVIGTGLIEGTFKSLPGPKFAKKVGEEKYT